MSLISRIAHASRNAHLWLPGYVASQCQRRRILAKSGPARRLWLVIADHFEPRWKQASDEVAAVRVERWRKAWPEIADRHRDALGRKAQYTFFYPQEEYGCELLDRLAEMRESGVADVEVHLHHDRDSEAAFLDRLGWFLDVLSKRHGLLRKHQGKITFGFIHGNWALDNACPDGHGCGLNNEILLLRKLGCYADFTLPAAPSAAQTRTINTIYWAIDDPWRPRSHERGIPVTPGGREDGDLLIIPGPLGLLWKDVGRPWPKLEVGELAANNPVTEPRVRTWLQCAPRIGEDLFLKLFTHGAQELNAQMLLAGGLDHCLRSIEKICFELQIELCYVTAWEMRQVIDRLRQAA